MSLTPNPSKTKYMFISYRPASCTFSLPPLLLSGSPISCVDEYKYLGITLTSSLSWTKHISIVSSKARRLLGLLYHQFYHNLVSTTLLHLYIVLILPHLEYCSLQWDPHSSHLSTSIEKIQYFAFKICTKDWMSNYSTLLNKMNLPTLSSCCRTSKLICIFFFLTSQSRGPPFLPPCPSTSFLLSSLLHTPPQLNPHPC